MRVVRVVDRGENFTTLTAFCSLHRFVHVRGSRIRWWRLLASTTRRRASGLGSAKLARFAKFCKFLAGSFSAVSKRNFASVTAFFKLYKIFILLHRCNLKIFAKSRFEKSEIFVKSQQKICKCRKNCKFCQNSKISA